MATLTREKTYSIGQVAQMFNLSVPAIRYYDQQKLILNLKKNKSGIRQFTNENIATLKMIECLKNAGMPIKDIQEFMKMVQKGDETLPDRLKMFLSLKQKVEKQMEEIQNTLDMINFKCDYYSQAVKDGTEDRVKKEMPLSNIVKLDMKER